MKSILIKVFLISNVFIAVACRCKDYEVKQVSCSVCQCKNSEWLCNILTCFLAPPAGPQEEKNFLTSLRRVIAKRGPVHPPDTVEEIGADTIPFDEDENRRLLHIMQNYYDGITSKNQLARNEDNRIAANVADDSLISPPVKSEKHDKYVQMQKKSSKSKVRAHSSSRKSKNKITDDLDVSERHRRSLEQSISSFKDSKRKRSRKDKSSHKMKDENPLYYGLTSDSSYNFSPHSAKPINLSENKENLNNLKTFEPFNRLEERKGREKNIFFTKKFNESRSKGKKYDLESSFPSKKAIKKYLYESHSIKQVHDDDSDENLRIKRSLNSFQPLNPSVFKGKTGCEKFPHPSENPISPVLKHRTTSPFYSSDPTFHSLHKSPLSSSITMPTWAKTLPTYKGQRFELLPAYDDRPLGYQESFGMRGDEYSPVLGLLGNRDKRSADSPVIYLTDDSFFDANSLQKSIRNSKMKNAVNVDVDTNGKTNLELNTILSELTNDSKNNIKQKMDRNFLSSLIKGLRERNIYPHLPYNKETQEISLFSNRATASRKHRSAESMESSSEEIDEDEHQSTRSKRDILKIIDRYVIMSFDPHKKPSSRTSHVFQIPAPVEEDSAEESNSKSNEYVYVPPYILGRQANTIRPLSYNNFDAQIPYDYQKTEKKNHNNHHGHSQDEEHSLEHLRPYIEQTAAINELDDYEKIETNSEDASNSHIDEENANSEDEDSTPVTPNDENYAHGEDRNVVKPSSSENVNEQVGRKANILDDISDATKTINSEWEIVPTDDTNIIKVAVESSEKHENVGVSPTEPAELVDADDLPENMYVVLSGKDDAESVLPTGTLTQKPSFSDILSYLDNLPLNDAGSEHEKKLKQIISFLKQLAPKNKAN